MCHERANASVTFRPASSARPPTIVRMFARCSTLAARIEVPVAVYDEIRDDDGRFLVAPGHEGSQRERIVAADGTWRVIAPGSVSPRAR
jgi:hypothetical protein